MGERRRAARATCAAGFAAALAMAWPMSAGAARPGTIEQWALPGYPHPVTAFIPAGATQALVVLHGGGATALGMAQALGLNSAYDTASRSTVNWTWLSAHRAIAVFPQGQAIPEVAFATTWSNHTMTSGQDDLGFLQALATKIRTSYPGVTRTALMGHSMGGTMAVRTWCEANTTYDRYVSIAGPAAAYYFQPVSCNPGSAPRPYLGIFGGRDDVMQTTDAWTATTWAIAPGAVATAPQAFIDPTMIGEWVSHSARTQWRCLTTPAVDAPVSSTAKLTVWRSCDGALEEQLLPQAGHDLTGPGSLGANYGTSSTALIDAAMAFIER